MEFPSHGSGGDWTTAIIFDAKHGAFEDYPIHFPCPTTPPTPGPESSPSGSSDANAASAGLIAGVVVGAAVVLLVLLAGYFILKNRRAAPLPMMSGGVGFGELVIHLEKMLRFNKILRPALRLLWRTGFHPKL